MKGLSLSRVTVHQKHGLHSHSFIHFWMINGPYLSVNFPCSFPPTFSFILSLLKANWMGACLSTEAKSLPSLSGQTGSRSRSAIQSQRACTQWEETRTSKWEGGRQVLAGHFKKAVTSLIWMLFFGSLSLSETAQDGESVDGRIWDKFR